MGLGSRHWLYKPSPACICNCHIVNEFTAWVGVHTKFKLPCIIVNFVFTTTKLIQNLRYGIIIANKFNSEMNCTSFLYI